MKKIFLFLIFLLIPFLSFSEISWHTNLTTAQAVAASEGKLIVIDFWATWCKPCTQMDRDLWNSEEMEALSDRAVFLKLDFDREKYLMKKYDVTAIPKVTIVNIVGEKLWEKVGYDDNSDYLKVFQTIPNDTKSLNEFLLPFLSDEKINEEKYISVGLEYQNLGKKQEEKQWRKIFLRESNGYLKKAKKKTKKEDKPQIELLMILNQAYLGKIKKAKKKLSKINESDFIEPTIELKKFIMAYCYKKEGDEKMFIQIKDEITNKNYLEELNLIK